MNHECRCDAATRNEALQSMVPGCTGGTTCLLSSNPGKFCEACREHHCLTQTIAALTAERDALANQLRDAPRGNNGSHWDECWRTHIDCAVAEIGRLREALQWFIDDEDCRLDHHGYCQTHGSFEEGSCRMVVARAALGGDASGLRAMFDAVPDGGER